MNALEVFENLKLDIQLLVQPCHKLVVTSDDEAKNALSAASQVKALSKAVEERRKDLVGPLNEEVKRINGIAKQVSEPLVDVEIHLKRQLAAWNDVLAERRREELKRVEEEKRKALAEADKARKEAEEQAALLNMFGEPDVASSSRAEIEREVESVKAVATIESTHKSQVKDIASMKVSGARSVWSFEVLEPATVPREFLMVDEKAIREAVRGGIREIPGVRIYSETVVAISGARR